MRTKGPPPADSFPETLSPALSAALQLGQLKQLYRQGWLRRGLPEPKCESVAEHSCGVAWLAMLLADDLPAEVDHHRLLQLALLHDAGEVHAGDITPADGVLAEDKDQQERQSVTQVFAGLPSRERYLALWEEYHAGESLEAKIVRQLDRLEMAIQAVVYQRSEAIEVEEFLQSAGEAIELPVIRAMFEEVRDLATRS